jgi:hypothetical protein
VNPPPKPKRWWRRLRLSLFILTPLVLPLLIGLALYEYSRVVENLTNNIVTIATRYKVDLEIEKLHGNLLRGLRTGPVEIYLPQNGVHIEVDSLTATFSLWTIIGGHLEFSHARVFNGRVSINPPKRQMDSLKLRNYDFPPLPWLDFHSLFIDSVSILLPVSQRLYFSQISGQLETNRQAARLDIKAGVSQIARYLPQIDSLRIRGQGDSSLYTLSAAELYRASDTLALNGSFRFAPRAIVNMDLQGSAGISALAAWGYDDLLPVLFEAPNYRIAADFSGDIEAFRLALSLRGNSRVDTLRYRAGGEFYFQEGEWYASQMQYTGPLGNVEGTFSFSNDGTLNAIAGFNPLHIPARISGTRDLQMRGWTGVYLENFARNRLQGNANLLINDLAFGDLHIERLSLYANALQGNIFLHDSSRIRFTDSSQVTLSGQLDARNNLDISAFGLNNSLIDYTLPLTGQPVFGRFTGFLNFQGPLLDPTFFADVTVDSLTYAGLYLQQATLQANIERLARRRNGFARVTGFGGQLYDQPLTEALVEMRVRGNRVDFDQLRLVDAQRKLLSRAYLDVAQQRLGIDTLFASYSDYSFASQGPFEVSWGEENYRGSALHFKDNKSGELRASNWQYPLLPGQSNITIENINIGAISRLVAPALSLSGHLSGIVEGISGSGQRIPQTRFFLIADSLSYATVDFGEVVLRGQSDSLRFMLDELRIDGNNLVLDLNGSMAHSGNEDVGQALDFSFRGVDLRSLAALIPGETDIAGRFSGTGSIAGSWKNPQILLQLRGLNPGYGEFRGNAIELTAVLRDSLLNISNARIFLADESIRIDWEMPLRVDLMQPRFAPGFPIYLQSSAMLSGKSITLPSIPYVDEVSGDLQWNVEATITDSSIFFDEGEVKFTNSTIQLSEIENPIFAAAGEMRLLGSTIELTRFSANTQRPRGNVEQFFSRLLALFGSREDEIGELQGAGLIDLSRFDQPRVDMQLSGDNVYVQYLPANLSLTSDFDELTIAYDGQTSMAGEIDITYAEMIVSSDMLNRLSYLYGTSGVSSGSADSYRLKINLPGNAHVRSEGFRVINNFNMEVMGELTVTRAQNTGVTGNLEVLSGNVYYVKDFAIAYGRIDFTSPTKIDSRLDIVAERSEKGKYLIQFVANGPIDNLKYDVIVRDIDTRQIIVMSDSDKMALLTLGVERGNFAADSLAGQGNEILVEATGKALEGLARQYNFADRIEFQANAYRPGATSLASYFTYGKYLTNDLYVEYQGQLSQLDVSGAYIPMPNFTWQAGNQLGIRYRLNRHWSLNTTMLRTFENNNKYRLDLRWKTDF